MPSVVLLWLHKPRAYSVILKTTECSRQGTEAICSHIVMGHMSAHVRVCACVRVCAHMQMHLDGNFWIWRGACWNYWKYCILYSVSQVWHDLLSPNKNTLCFPRVLNFWEISWWLYLIRSIRWLSDSGQKTFLRWNLFQHIQRLDITNNFLLYGYWNPHTMTSLTVDVSKVFCRER